MVPPEASGHGDGVLNIDGAHSATGQRTTREGRYARAQGVALACGCA